MTHQLRAVLFDLDGTLIDSVGLLLSSMRYAFEGFAGATPTDAEWIAGIGTPLMIQIGAYGRTPAESTAKGFARGARGNAQSRWTSSFRKCVAQLMHGS